MKGNPDNSSSNIYLPSPIYFPSISSVKTLLTPAEYTQIMLHLKDMYPFFLISAYDVAKTSLQALLEDAIARGITVLMDCGNYESYWKHTDWSQDDFHSILSRTSCPFVFCYDNQSPPKDISAHKEDILSGWQDDIKHCNGNILIPIIHGRKEDIPELCQYVAIETKSRIIAVPERKLGNGLIERAKTVADIRSKLNDNSVHVQLHLLGTGNPISIAVYSIMGADSFDGLEWCQTAVDPETALLFHFSQAELFFGRSGYEDVELPYVLKTLAHNLEFYSGWMKQLQVAIRANKAIEFCETRFPRNIFSTISSALHWRKLV